MPGPGVSVHLAHPLSLERASALPVAALYLWEALPRPALQGRQALLEDADPASGRVPFRAVVRRPPQWIQCRFALAIRGRAPEEELDLFSAALQGLHDLPSLRLDAFASLRDESSLRGVADLLPVSVEESRELWKTLGLPRHVLMLGFTVTVPLPSARREPAVRVFERQLEMDVEAGDTAGATKSAPAPGLLGALGRAEEASAAESGEEES